MPVAVVSLERTMPQSDRVYAGSVRSWKVEDITFEVEGRVEWVLEPGTQIEGPIYKSNGELSPGTQIAQLDESRFLTALQSAQTQVGIAELKRDGIQTRIAEALPTEIRAAEVELKQAQSDVERNQRLVDRNAGAVKNLEAARTARDTAQAKLDGLKARALEAKAELKSAEAAIAQAMLSVKDAERDIKDTKLHAPFRGQLAAIHVVPGSLAGKQSKVATVQMMNPIKVELEISAEASRRIKLGDNLNVTFSTGGREPETAEASVYAIAPSADNATRTFTLTLLVANRKLPPEVPEGLAAAELATTTALWRVGLGILPPSDKNAYYMPENGLHTDSTGDYVWRVTNFKAGEPTQRVLKVEKLYVKLGDESVPFLGQTRFRTVSILPDQRFQPELDLFAIDLVVDGQRPKEWSGDTMLLDKGTRWLLRPGDVVEVVLSTENTQPGFFLPIEAIHEQSGRTSIFVVEEEGTFQKVKQVQVTISEIQGDRTTTVRRVEAVSDDTKLDGARVVVEGTHYLTDGQEVVITQVSEEWQ